MIRFVLDTDILSLLQHGHSTVVSHVSRCLPGEVATSIITVEEQLTAWYTLLRRAKRPTDLVPVYDRMTQTVCFLRRLPILTFSNVAAETYDRLRKQKPRTGRMDLRGSHFVLPVVPRNSSCVSWPSRSVSSFLNRVSPASRSLPANVLMNSSWLRKPSWFLSR